MVGSNDRATETEADASPGRSATATRVDAYKVTPFSPRPPPKPMPEHPMKKPSVMIPQHMIALRDGGWASKTAKATVMGNTRPRATW